jgi:hypothetical protein
MGYRSNVAYLILFPSDEEYHSFLSEVSALSGQPIQNEEFGDINGIRSWGDMVSALAETVHGVDMYDQPYLSLDNVHKKFPAIAFKAEDVKWYPAYLNVHSHESLVNLAKLRTDITHKRAHLIGTNQTALMTRCSVEYLRIGEDTSDVEEYSQGRHICLSASPIWMRRSVSLCEAMEKLFDKEDV